MQISNVNKNSMPNIFGKKKKDLIFSVCTDVKCCIRCIIDFINDIVLVSELSVNFS